MTNRSLRSSSVFFLSLATAALVATAAGATSVTSARIGPGRAAANALRVLQPKREKGLANRVSVFFLRRQLPRGSSLSEAVTHRRLIRLARPAWLFWEDLGHGMLFPHASKVLLVDARSGKPLFRKNLTFFPLVNGRPASFVRSAPSYLRSTGAIYVRGRRLRLAAAASAPQRARAHVAGLEADAIVTVGAREDFVFKRSFAEIEKLGDDLKIPTVKAKPSEQGAKDAIAEVVKKGRSDVLLFIGGHGYPERDHTYVDKDGKKQVSAPASKLPKILLDDKGSSGESITSLGVGRILDAFPNTTFKVVIDSCFSGRFIATLATHTNVRISITSAPADKPSYQGSGAVLAAGLRTWAFPPSGERDPPDLVGGLRKAFASAPVTTHSDLTKTPAQIETPPVIKSLSAVLVAPATTYTVAASDSDPGDTLKYDWSRTSVSCGTFTGSDAPTATWSHPNDPENRQPPPAQYCRHNAGTNHPGTVTVVVRDKWGASATCSYSGSENGKQTC